MKPCDCKSIEDTIKYLNEQGLSFNNWSISVIPNSVIISNSTTNIKIPMYDFKKFAKWFLENQKKDG